jgi:hypothetical protein
MPKQTAPAQFPPIPASVGFELERLRAPGQEYGGRLTPAQIEHLLRSVPGSRRAASGVLIPVDEERSFHLTRILPVVRPGMTPEDFLYYPICTPNEVARLREIKSAHDYLLLLRAKCIADDPRFLRVMESRREAWEGKGRFWSLSDYYASLNQAPKRYIGRLSRANKKLVRTIPFGYSAVREVNAICMRSLVGDVVTVSEMLREFYYFFVICVTGENHGIAAEDYMTSGLIAIRIMTGGESQDFDLDPRCEPPSKLEAELRGQVDAMLEFTYGHEFSHQLLGHLDSAESVDDIIQYSCDREFAADRTAVLNVLDRKARKRIAKGAYMVLFALHFIDEIAAARAEVPRFSGSSTHPAPIDRIWALHRALGASDALREGAILRDLATITAVTSAIIERLKELRPDMLTFYGSLYLGGLGGKFRQDRIDF